MKFQLNLTFFFLLNSPIKIPGTSRYVASTTQNWWSLTEAVPVPVVEYYVICTTTVVWCQLSVVWLVVSWKREGFLCTFALSFPLSFVSILSLNFGLTLDDDLMMVWWWSHNRNRKWEKRKRTSNYHHQLYYFITTFIISLFFSFYHPCTVHLYNTQWWIPIHHLHHRLPLPRPTIRPLLQLRSLLELTK